MAFTFCSLMPAKWVDLFDEMFADLHESHRWKLGRVDTNLVSAMKSFTGPIRLKAKNDSRSVSLWYRLTKKRAGQRLGKVLVSFEREIQTAADWLVEDVEEILFTVYEEISCKLYGRPRYEDPDPAERLWVIDPMQEQSRAEEIEDWSESTLPSIWLDAFKQIFELKDWSLVPADRDPEDNTQPLEMNTRSGRVSLWLRLDESSKKVVLVRCNDSKKPPSKPMKEWRIIDIRRVLRTFRWNVETSDVVLE
jgi:hypothetical protein